MRIGCVGEAACLSFIHRPLLTLTLTLALTLTLTPCQIDNLPRRGPPAFIPKIPTLHATSFDRIAGHPARSNSAHYPPTAPPSPPSASNSVEVSARSARDSSVKKCFTTPTPRFLTSYIR